MHCVDTLHEEGNTSLPGFYLWLCIPSGYCSASFSERHRLDDELHAYSKHEGLWGHRAEEAGSVAEGEQMSLVCASSLNS